MKKTILVADDEEAIRQSLCLILEEEGFRCTEAHDGIQAVKLACTGAFDLVILDLFMPGKSGLDAMKEIKKCWPDIPILLLSSYFDVEAATEALKRGALQYMLKPINFDELIAAIHRILPEESNHNK